QNPSWAANNRHRHDCDWSIVRDTEYVSKTLWGEADIRFEDSQHDPLSRLKPVRIIGANFVAGSQVLNWGKVVG
ncbi:MAG: hypothetical protein ACI8P9_004061, partial [Parasphingorhabdus sp.]